MRRGLALLLCVATPSAAAAPKAELLAAYQALVEQDARLATIGYRLASANAPFCKSKTRDMGWVLHDERQYPDLETARSAFPFRQKISIAAIVPNGPAARAGMKAGDGFVAANDAVFVYGLAPKRHVANYERINLVKELVADSLALTGPVKLTMQIATPAQNADGFAQFTVDPPAICASEFWVDPQEKVDAGADGTRVRITTGMMAFAPDEDDLAFIAAHEMAHNLLGHSAHLKSKKRGKRKAILASEVEADRLALWLMANAGYNAHKAVPFIERYGRKYDPKLLGDGTHPGWKQRAQYMSAELKDIENASLTAAGRAPPLLQ